MIQVKIKNRKRGNEGGKGGRAYQALALLLLIVLFLHFLLKPLCLSFLEVSFPVFPKAFAVDVASLLLAL